MTPYRPFKSVLVANRGEIAVRIVREAKAAGLRAIAVCSDADRDARHVELADAAVHIGPSPAAQSYLDGAKIIDSAKAAGAEAIHPGYGFLSENADFAQAVIDAGLVWIGPSPEAIRAMGDKGKAKEIARKAGVPVIPGYDGDDQSDQRLLTEARKIGWPVLIKAANGGGGRGQRRVADEGDFTDALASARRESLSAFASDRMILERALENVRHVEVQVFGDAQGNVIHLGERDCSVQRRNQKIVEEAPAPGVTPELRAKIGEAAANLARAVGYVNAGTVEYLLDRDGKFYFLEMNTRIQVEHPVTEEVTGLNLIRMQFDVAMGKPLALKQDAVRISGHAIEARLCAEDPATGFAPQTGEIEAMHLGSVARADSAGAQGRPASGHYDSMLAKLIAHGKTREEARTKLLSELNAAQVLGIRTNRNFLIGLLQRGPFVSGEVDIGWLEREPPYADDNLDGVMAPIAALALASSAGDAWRSTGPARTIVLLRERTRVQRFVVEGYTCSNIRIAETHQAEGRGTVHLGLVRGDQVLHADVFRRATLIHVHHNGHDALFEDVTYAPAEPKSAGGDGAVRAPMAGKIVRVNVAPGAKVEKGQVLVILEAMKMEHEIVARGPGTVAAVSVKVGDQVAARQVLLTLAI